MDEGLENQAFTKKSAQMQRNVYNSDVRKTQKKKNEYEMNAMNST